MINYLIEKIDEEYYLNTSNAGKDFRAVLQQLPDKVASREIGYQGLTIDEVVILQRNIRGGRNEQANKVL